MAARARAQQPAMPVIGLLGSVTARQWAPFTAAFLQGLSETGIVEGRNATVEYRWAEGQYDRLPALAAELVHRDVAVIAALTTPAAVAAKAATTQTPIIFTTIGDPVQIGLVASLSRPGGNITGVTYLNVEVGPKLLELLHEAVPTATTMAALVNPTNPNADTLSTSLRLAARTLGLQFHIVNASTEPDIENAFGILVEQQVGGLVVPSDVFLITHEERVAALALSHRLPAIFQTRTVAAAGGLMSYSGNAFDVYRQAGSYTGRVLKGEKPGGLASAADHSGRADHQSAERKGARTQPPALAPWPCRRGDRMSTSRVHLAARRRGSVAARGARAAGSDAARRRAHARSRDDAEVQARLAAFLRGLQQAGWTVGQNLRIDYRWARPHAAEIANTRPNWPRSRRTSS